jgi:hypothetical protein
MCAALLGMVQSTRRRWSRYVFTSGTSAQPEVLKALRKLWSQQR